MGRSFVEKRGKEGRNGGSSIEESGSSTGESRAKVRCCGGRSALRVGRSFVEKRGKAGRDGDSSIEESDGSTGESRAKVR